MEAGSWQLWVLHPLLASPHNMLRAVPGAPVSMMTANTVQSQSQEFGSVRQEVGFWGGPQAKKRKPGTLGSASGSSEGGNANVSRLNPQMRPFPFLLPLCSRFLVSVPSTKYSVSGHVLGTSRFHHSGSSNLLASSPATTVQTRRTQNLPEPFPRRGSKHLLWTSNCLGQGSHAVP